MSLTSRWPLELVVQLEVVLTGTLHPFEWAAANVAGASCSYYWAVYFALLPCLNHPFNRRPDNFTCVTEVDTPCELPSCGRSSCPSVTELVLAHSAGRLHSNHPFPRQTIAKRGTNLFARIYFRKASPREALSFVLAQQCTRFLQCWFTLRQNERSTYNGSFFYSVAGHVHLT